ncbi:MAG TPA: ATP-dependent DNA helicase [Pyrinomonadaceae bacterium]|nr:ATP-dependent DNA helicase [Pyrinomonadaceae bacterium]
MKEDNNKNGSEKVFAPGGIVSKFHDDYEYREGQVEMAEKIAEAFESKKHLIVEAGTGTGKTLAYLVPAIAAAIKGKCRIIISTGTKNLQEQLMEKDLPFLQKALPTKFKAAYMKGRANYACMYRISHSGHQPILDGMDDVDHFRVVREWMEETKTGDRAELTDLPENLAFWNRINARADTCLGQKCPDFEPCFITRMRNNAENAEIVVVNHHLFFADLNVRDNQFGRVLPDYSAVIFDEAHLLEDIAADYFGVQASNYQIEELARDAEALPINNAVSAAAITKAAGKVLSIAESFWQRLMPERQVEGRFQLSPDISVERGDGMSFGDSHIAFAEALSRLEALVDAFSGEMVEAESVVRRLKQARTDIAFITRQDDSNYVYWLERRGRGIFLQASPVDVSALLYEKLFDKTNTCILTSATLATKGGFNFIRDRLGLPSARTMTLTAPSSFDYETQSIVYLPKAMPDPRSPDYTSAAAREITDILRATNGRAFVLCTSNASMNALYQLVSSRVGYTCFLQGTISKTGLIERFRSTPNAVLFATQSFWQGVDVRGDMLSCVIIDKLPFAVPTDPLVAARARFIDERGGASFFEYSVPQAIITLKQGIGRLIRSRSDRGVIAILDPRLRTKNYGRDFLASLPRMLITGNITEAAEFLERG